MIHNWVTHLHLNIAEWVLCEAVNRGLRWPWELNTSENMFITHKTKPPQKPTNLETHTQHLKKILQVRYQQNSESLQVAPTATLAIGGPHYRTTKAQRNVLLRWKVRALSQNKRPSNALRAVVLKNTPSACSYLPVRLWTCIKSWYSCVLVRHQHDLVKFGKDHGLHCLCQSLPGLL